MISIKNVSFSYNKNKKVLDNISFDIFEGECVILLGPNGVGKSTLLSLILKANKLKEGNIYFDDIQLKDLTSKQKSDYLAYVPQLIQGTNLTCKETILLGRLPHFYLYPSKEDYEKVDELIKEFSLEEIKDKETNQISGGERQKVSVARGFIQNSKVVIFDEPTSNLDVKAQLDVINLIKNEKNKKQRSFLISMHDINQALSIGDKFIFLKEGRIHSICKKEEINETLLKEVYGVNAKIIKLEKEIHVIYEN